MHGRRSVGEAARAEPGLFSGVPDAAAREGADPGVQLARVADESRRGGRSPRERVTASRSEISPRDASRPGGATPRGAPPSPTRGLRPRLGKFYEIYDSM